jgi:hypothetical protein
MLVFAIGSDWFDSCLFSWDFERSLISLFGV